jgi:hypothetical protein
MVSVHISEAEFCEPLLACNSCVVLDPCDCGAWDPDAPGTGPADSCSDIPRTRLLILPLVLAQRISVHACQFLHFRCIFGRWVTETKEHQRTKFQAPGNVPTRSDLTFPARSPLYAGSARLQACIHVRHQQFCYLSAWWPLATGVYRISAIPATFSASLTTQLLQRAEV